MRKTHDDHEIVSYGFVMLLGSERHEIQGKKTLKLFRSWFRLASSWHYSYTPKNRHRQLLYGFVRFSDNETWIWQNKKHTLPGGWQIALDPTTPQLKLF